jgi:hypothetical protein
MSITQAQTWLVGSIGVRMVLCRDGVASRRQVFVTSGAAMVGDPTAFVQRDGRSVWVKPGESVDFVEV